MLFNTTNTLPAINNVEGVAISAGSYGGRFEVSRNSNEAVAFNRMNTDGNVLAIKKNGATVGSIGTAGNQSYIHGAGTDVGIYFGSNNLYPYRSTGLNDATIDLGQSGKRFKDAYLSGGVYLGGTGTANKLDDYEEGTWTPSLTLGAVPSGNYNIQNGYYTKIGRQVSITLRIQLSALGTNQGGADIAGLPFAVHNVTGGNCGAYFGFLDGVSSNWSAYTLIPTLDNGASNIRLRFNNASGAWQPLNQGDLTNTSDIIMSATYFTS